MKNRIVIGMSGASGAPLAVELLRQLERQEAFETHLVVTEGAMRTLAAETKLSPEQLFALADRVYDNGDLGAAIASGSFRTAGMAVVPCSMKTLAGIANGFSENLLLRAADVTLKERRRLVVVPRETPMSVVHLRNLYELGMMGAVVLPPMLSYYHHPTELSDCTRHIVGKILDQFSIDGEGYRRWEEE